MNNITDEIKQLIVLRKSKEISQETIARETGFSKTKIYRLENGKVNVEHYRHIDMLRKYKKFIEDYEYIPPEPIVPSKRVLPKIEYITVKIPNFETMIIEEKEMPVYEYLNEPPYHLQPTSSLYSMGLKPADPEYGHEAYFKCFNKYQGGLTYAKLYDVNKTLKIKRRKKKVDSSENIIVQTVRGSKKVIPFEALKTHVNDRRLYLLLERDEYLSKQEAIESVYPLKYLKLIESNELIIKWEIELESYYEYARENLVDFSKITCLINDKGNEELELTGTYL